MLVLSEISVIPSEVETSKQCVISVKVAEVNTSWDAIKKALPTWAALKEKYLNWKQVKQR